MQGSEKDGQRCRQLRQSVETIDKQIENFVDEEKRARNQLNKLRSELSAVIDEIRELDILFVAAAVASGGRSLVSTGIGFVGGDISSKISALKRKREILKFDINYIIAEIKSLRNNINRFIRSRDKSGEEMNNFNCALGR